MNASFLRLLGGISASQHCRLVTDGGHDVDEARPTASLDGGVASQPAGSGPDPGEDTPDESIFGEPSEVAAPPGDRIDPAVLSEQLAAGNAAAGRLANLLGERTVNVNGDLDEDAFFSGISGEPTVVSRYDLEKAVPPAKKRHFQEVDRYWVNKPFAFVVLFHSEKENERKYYVVEPHLTETEEQLRQYLTEKLTNTLTYSWQDRDNSAATRTRVIEDETYKLLARYNIYASADESDAGFLDAVKSLLGLQDAAVRADAGPGADGDTGAEGRDTLRIYPSTEDLGRLDGTATRPESTVLADGRTTLTEYQVEKLLYYLRRDFIGYGRIDPIKHDVNVEDISCDGYHSPVFVYHTDYEQLITNVSHAEEELDDFVVKLAQRSNKSISKRQPQVDATLPDGSRAQLTLGREVSDRGTNYTIRQFKDVPFTPIDLVNWHTFSLDQIAFLWLCIENKKSMMVAGGTASGKTTSLNALSLFIPSDAKIVSIEDTREVELPQRNWVASVTRPSLAADERGDIDEFDLLEAALRQRPDYLVMGEVRGEEGRTLFQMMSTGHTTYTTFHADSVGEVIDRFTTDPINVSRSLFTALDLVSIQAETRVQGRKVRRCRTLTEINQYDTKMDELNVQDIYQWQPATDEFKQLLEPNVLDDIKFDRGWDDQRLQEELFKRRTLLAYLVDRHVNTYAEVAAAIQGFISDPDAILGLMARDELDDRLADLRSMESVLIDINPEKEEMVPRPDPNDRVLSYAGQILDEAEQRLFDDYADAAVDDLETVLRDPTQFDWNTDNARVGGDTITAVAGTEDEDRAAGVGTDERDRADTESAVRRAVDRMVRTEDGELDYDALQSVAADTEGVPGSGIAAEEMYERVVEAKAEEAKTARDQGEGGSDGPNGDRDAGATRGG